MGRNNQYVLSEEEKQFYDENGYIIIRKLIDYDTVEFLRQRFLDVCHGKVDKGPMTLVKDVELSKVKEKPEEYINKLNNLSHDPGFARYTDHPRLVHVLSQLMGSPGMSVYNSMLVNKPPGTKWHPPHQDLFFINMRPVEKIMSSWTAIDPVAPENGSLFVVPGSHKANKVYDHVQVPNFTSRLFFMIPYLDEVAPESRRVSVAPMEPGDTIIFHSLLVHGSWPNKSNTYRKAITNVYVSDECQYIDIKGTVHETFERELSKTYQEYANIEMTLEDFNNMRKRHVVANKSNL